MGREYSIETNEDLTLKGVDEASLYILGSWGDGIGGRDFRKGASSAGGREGETEVRLRGLGGIRLDGRVFKIRRAYGPWRVR